MFAIKLKAARPHIPRGKRRAYLHKNGGKEKGHLQKQVPKNWMRQQPNLPWGDPKVLSAQESLTSVFGMRTGGSSPLSSPQWLYNPLSRDIYCMISSPYPKELTISSAGFQIYLCFAAAFCLA